MQSKVLQILGNSRLRPYPVLARLGAGLPQVPRESSNWPKEPVFVVGLCQNPKRQLHVRVSLSLL